MKPELEEREEIWYTFKDYVSFRVSAYTILGKDLENTGAAISV
jgi:hypothetical protein